MSLFSVSQIHTCPVGENRHGQACDADQCFVKFERRGEAWLRFGKKRGPFLGCLGLVPNLELSLVKLGRTEGGGSQIAKGGGDAQLGILKLVGVFQ